MPKFQLKWSDEFEALDPRVVTENGEHTYTFETGSMDDAEQVVRSFKMVAGQHDFSNAKITEVQE